MTGRASAHGDSALSCSAEVQSLDLAGQPWLGRMLGRELRGRLSGTLAAQFEMRSGLLSALEGRLSAQDGAIPLTRPAKTSLTGRGGRSATAASGWLPRWSWPAGFSRATPKTR